MVAGALGALEEKRLTARARRSNELNFGKGTSDWYVFAHLQRDVHALTVSEHQNDVQSGVLGRFAFLRTLGEKGDIGGCQLE